MQRKLNEAIGADVYTQNKEVARAPRRARIGIIDCDIHNGLQSPDALKPYLASRWHHYYDQLATRAPAGGFYSSGPQPGLFRADAAPPSGQEPGTDLGFLQEQLLERWNIERGILSPLDMLGWPQYGELGAALSSALNDWSLAEWLEHDNRLYGSIIITTEDAPRAVREIERCAASSRYVQVLLVVRTREPLGHPKYWPIYEAATASHLPVTIHVGGAGGAVTGVGWPSYHYEAHVSYVFAYVAHVVSLIYSGVFATYPDLRVVLQESGFSWVPALIWRMDRSWRLMKEHVPHLDIAPSELIRKHFWFTTQPIDEAETESHFMQMIGHLAMNDRIMFATDYPHWDFDAPDRALPKAITGSLKEMILRRNAETLFFDMTDR